MPRLPTVVSVTAEIPLLFSFGACDPYSHNNTISNLFNEAQAWLNSASTSGHGVLYNYVPFEQSLPDYITVVTNNSPVDTELLARLRMAEILLLFNKLEINRQTKNFAAEFELCHKINDFIEFLSRFPFATDEYWWYLSVTIVFRILQEKEMIREDLNELLLAIQHIQSLRHKKAIHYWIVYYGSKNHLFTVHDTRILDAVFPSIPWDHVALAVLSRHNFILKKLANKNYFEHISNYTQPLVSNALYHDINFPDGTLHRFTFTKNDLLKFAAHIFAPSTPILEFYLSDISATSLNNFNIQLRKYLRTLGHCNARGFIRPSFFKEKPNTIKEQILRALWDCKIITSRESETIYRNKLKGWKPEIIEPEYQRLLKVMKELEGYGPQDALHLIHECLIVHPFGLDLNLLNRIKSVLLKCLYYSTQCDKFKGETYITSQSHFFKLAGDIVDDLYIRREPILLQVGTPIEPLKLHSNHAIYVALKCQNDNTVRVIITNGGLGVNYFHQTTMTGIEKDDEEYRYAAFAPVELVENNKLLLQNYIYRALLTRYINAKDLVGEGSGNGSNRPHNFYNDSYDNIMRDLYLRKNIASEPAYFRGYQFKKFNWQRDDLEQSFLTQFTGNCTIHNMKKALQILFDMDEPTFGKFEDNLLLGFDHLITLWGMPL